jgi:hypothetical protein
MQETFQIEEGRIRRLHLVSKSKSAAEASHKPAPASAVSDFAKLKLGFEPDALQTAVLDSQSKRGVLNCTRQWGKSTVLAIKAVHRACTVAGSLILVASPCSRQSGEFLRKAAGFLSRLGIRRRGDGDNACSLLLPNGSRIVGIPGKEATIRGFSAVSLLLIDEASRLPDETYKSLRPMLAVGNGDLWLMSTPFGKRGFFYEACEHGDAWERHAAPATVCPRILPGFLEDERSAMGPKWFAQEYLCEFLDDSNGWFTRTVLDGAMSERNSIWS